MGLGDVADVLSDSHLTWPRRLAHLQGWRGEDADRAEGAPVAQRIAPAACALGAFAGAASESPLVLTLFAASAAVGAVAPNHPFEALYNRWSALNRGRTLPPNRAAKRLGCVIGAALLVGSATAYALGAVTVGLVLAVVLGGTATFVATTGICVPSMIFTLVWGTERACRPRLVPRRASSVEPTTAAW